MIDTIQIGILIILCLLFLMVPQLSDLFGSSLDTLPMRFAVIITLLAVVPYDRFIALGLFMVFCAVYIVHHQSDLLMNSGPSGNNYNGIKRSPAMNMLKQGGNADESLDIMDFIPKMEDQDNKFSSVDNTLNEKEILTSETLGSRSESLFPEDLKHVSALENGNRRGNSD